MAFTRPDQGLPAIAELAALPQWVVWASIERNGKATKVPFRSNGIPASSTARATWTTFDEACAATERGQACSYTDKKTGEAFSGIAAGVGFVVTEGDPYTGLDFDKCINGSGKPSAAVMEQLRRFRSYTEVSPSGTGVRVIVRGALPFGVLGKRKGGIEAYSSRRFLTITGNMLDELPDEIVDAEEELQRLGQELGAVDVAAEDYQRPAEGSLPAGRRFSWGGLTVVIPAEFPEAKVFALMENSDRFSQTWRKQRRDLERKDDSLSAYDMSLALQCLEAGLSDHEAAAVIARFRQKHGSTKWERDDYLPRTIDSARRFRHRGLSERQSIDEHQVTSVSEAAIGSPTSAPPGPVPSAALPPVEAFSTGGEGEDADPRRSSILASLSARFGGIPLRGILQAGTDPALYFLEMDGGRQIKLGDEKAVLSQRTIMGRVMAELRVVMPNLKPAVWQETLGLIMEILEVREIEETTFAGRMREMLELYLESNPPAELEPLHVDGTKPALVAQHKPFFQGGLLHLSLVDVGRILASHHDFRDISSFKGYLIAMDFIVGTVYGHNPSTGKSTSRSYWSGPRAKLKL